MRVSRTSDGALGHARHGAVAAVRDLPRGAAHRGHAVAAVRAEAAAAVVAPQRAARRLARGGGAGHALGGALAAGERPAQVQLGQAAAVLALADLEDGAAEPARLGAVGRLAGQRDGAVPGVDDGADGHGGGGVDGPEAVAARRLDEDAASHGGGHDSLALLGRRRERGRRRRAGGVGGRGRCGGRRRGGGRDRGGRGRVRRRLGGRVRSRRVRRGRVSRGCLRRIGGGLVHRRDAGDVGSAVTGAAEAVTKRVSEPATRPRASCATSRTWYSVRRHEAGELAEDAGAALRRAERDRRRPAPRTPRSGRTRTRPWSACRRRRSRSRRRRRRSRRPSSGRPTAHRPWRYGRSSRRSRRARGRARARRRARRRRE